VIRTQASVAGAFALLVGLTNASGCTSSNGAGEASCTNGVRDGDEVGVDCDGACATKCTGDVCAGDAECASAKCDPSKTCAAPAGKPCGVSTAIPTCDNGMPCELDKDCKSLTCDRGTCAVTAESPPGPADGKKNNGETDVDCGGPSAPKCDDGKACGTDTDCATG